MMWLWSGQGDQPAGGRPRDLWEEFFTRDVDLQGIALRNTVRDYKN